LEYLYSDHVKIDDTIALELLQQANKYFRTGKLKNECEKHLMRTIESENYVVLGKLAEAVRLWLDYRQKYEENQTTKRLQ